MGNPSTPVHGIKAHRCSSPSQLHLGSRVPSQHSVFSCGGPSFTMLPALGSVPPAPHLPLLPSTNTDDEVKEMEGQEETHAANTSSAAVETQELAGLPTATHGHLEQPPCHTTTEHCRDFHSKQRRFHKSLHEALAEFSLARAVCADA
ncbi:hypothetical protein Y1Q_0009292 [Alligator mississippiensis]|uniref:Uncharacterized protein n=1 Tax=Alligator mississippiensis TaxID=8496 RepID=A0A151NGN2_ALLMI|nr:hypothetical protein Y1Q_0009292 [Alligator mississippiensis]